MSEEPKADMTPFEMAQLRLRAFELLHGYGETDETGKFRRWGLHEKKAHAAELASWAAGTSRECSFCGQSAVKKLIGNRSVYICDECAAEAMRLMESDGAVDAMEGGDDGQD